MKELSQKLETEQSSKTVLEDTWDIFAKEIEQLKEDARLAKEQAASCRIDQGSRGNLSTGGQESLFQPKIRNLSRDASTWRLHKRRQFRRLQSSRQ
jgi:hypothetical protein